jgi:hypothetical protein
MVTILRLLNAVLGPFGALACHLEAVLELLKATYISP